MKIVVLGDLHLISPQDPYDRKRAGREEFAAAWPSVRRLFHKIRVESPDLVISLGDIVDWYTPESRDFALDLLEELSIPWMMTPGNHDFKEFEESADGSGGSVNYNGRDARPGWAQRGVDLSNRVVDVGVAQLLLMESALSFVPEGTGNWLAGVLGEGRRSLLFTHVPLNLPLVIEYILQESPGRDLKKYVQSGAPGLFERYLQGNVEAVFTGHLHFPGLLEQSGTEMHLLPMSTTAVGREFPGQGRATVLRLDKPPLVRDSIM